MVVDGSTPPLRRRVAQTGVPGVGRYELATGTPSVANDDGTYVDAHLDRYLFDCAADHRSPALTVGLSILCQHHGWEVVYVSSYADVPTALLRRWTTADREEEDDDEG